MRRGKRRDWSQIKSPCIKVCKLKDKICIGCGRTQDQIREWLIYSDEKRNCIMKTLKGKRYE